MEESAKAAPPSGDGGALGSDGFRRMTSDANRLQSMARRGEVSIDPDGARGIADAYDQMVDEIQAIRGRLRIAGQRPRLGSSPFAERVANYQSGAADSFLDVVNEFETACTACANAFREAAKHYTERDRDAADEFKKARRST